MNIEGLLSSCKSDDYDRYAKMGLRIEPQNPQLLQRQGHGLEQRQENIPWSEKDYTYIDYYRKAYENEDRERNPLEKELYLCSNKIHFVLQKKNELKTLTHH